MGRCALCNKFMLKNSKSGYCEECANEKLAEVLEANERLGRICEQLRAKEQKIRDANAIIEDEVEKLQDELDSLKRERERIQNEKEECLNTVREMEQRTDQLLLEMKKLEQEKEMAQEGLEELKSKIAKKEGEENNKKERRAQAEMMFGLAFEHGFGVIRKDASAAFQWFLRAAKGGNARAAGLVAIDYLSGDGIEEDSDQAFEWSKKAADQEDKMGMIAQGQIAERHAQYTAAYQWYKKAADFGDYNGMCNVGVFLLCGKGVTKNTKEAAQWNMKASAAGSATAAFNLAIQFMGGDGVPKNEERMMEYMQRAAELGHPQALRLLEY